jgi:predicted esterase
VLSIARESGRDGAAMPIVVALHRRGGDATEALATARRLFGDRADIVAPQAARPCNPFQSNLRAASGYEGFSWYLGGDPERPEAASFGDALAQLDACARQLGRSFVLSGEGQGAALAIALGLHAPEGLVGVHAFLGGVPSIDGWRLPVATLEHVEFLLADLEESRAADARAVLTGRRAIVVPVASLTTARASRWLESLHAPIPDEHRA